MDYSQLSDSEIAQKVWFWSNQNIEHDNTLCGMSGGKMLYVKNSVWTVFDPCNNPADAWPIIESNLICLAADVFAESHDGGKWVAQPAYGWEKERVRSNNPLRAAMIVFLMMQDAKHA